MIRMDLNFSQADIDAFGKTLHTFANRFNKGVDEGVKKGIVYIIRSLRASTDKSKQKRRVVKNPNFRKPTNKRVRQLQHIRAYYADKGRTYTDTAEYFDRYAIEKLMQGKKKTKYIPIRGLARNTTEAKAIAERDMANKLKIGRRGLAKASWGWMLKKMNLKSGIDEQPEINGATKVSRLKTPNTIKYTCTNALEYIRSALKANVVTVLNRARKAMIDELEGHKKRTLKKAA